MTAREITWLRDSYNLIYYYTSDDDVRNKVNSTFVYNNRPVFFYIASLIRFSPNYYSYYLKIFQRDVGYFSSKKVRLIWKDTLPNRVWTFFDKCKKDSKEYSRLKDVSLNNLYHPEIFSPQELEAFSQLDQLPQHSRVDLLEGLVRQINRGKFQDSSGLNKKNEIGEITDEEKKVAAYFLAEKIKKHGQQLIKQEDRDKLVQENVFTKKEVDVILRAGLVRGADVEPEYNKEGFENDEKWNKAVFESASTILEESRKKEERQAPAKPSQLTGPTIYVNLPKIKIPSKLKDFTSNSQILAKRAGIATAKGLGNMAKSTGGQLLRGGGSLALRGVGAASQAALRGLVMLGMSTGGTAATAVGVAVIVVIILLIVLFILTNLLQTSSLLPPFQPEGYGDVNRSLSLKKEGPISITFGQNIQYQISVTYSGLGKANIEITDQLPPQTEFVDATEGGVLTTGVVKWSLANVPTGQTTTVTLTIRPTSDDIYVTNTAEAKITSTTTLLGPGGLIDITSPTLATIFNQAGQYAGIPVAFLKAIGAVESAVLSYNEFEVVKFSTVGWWIGLISEAPTLSQNDPAIIRGYGYNTCKYLPPGTCAPGADVRGAMQFELNTWNGIKDRLIFADGRDPDRRNLMDVVFGSAMLNKQHALSLGVTASDTWDETTVRALARWYCAGSPYADPKVAACGWRKPGDPTYDDIAWLKYVEFTLP